MIRLILKFLIIILVAAVTLLTSCSDKSSPEIGKKPANSAAQARAESGVTSQAEPASKGREQLTLEQKLEDFGYMYNILKENYPFFQVNKRLYNVDWLTKRDVYESLIKSSSSDESFLAYLNIILRDLHNGHTGILSNNLYIKLRMIYQDLVKGDSSYSKWYEVLENEKALKRYGLNQNSPKTDSKINDNFTVTNNVRTEKLTNKVAYIGIKSLDTNCIEGDSKIIASFFNKIKDFKALVIDIRGNGGGDDRYWSDNIVSMLTDKDLNCNWYNLYRGGKYAEPFIFARTGSKYDKLPPVSDLINGKLKAYPTEIESDFKYYTTGGKIVKSKKYVDYKGDIYLLVDRGVYSSAEMFAAFSKDTGFAALVGETTGGDGIGMDPILCVLPNSGYILRFPSIMGLNSEGICNEEFKTRPDVKISASKNENLLNDECVKYVLGRIK